MSRKKRFGISEALTRGLSETIHVVENNAGLYRQVVLPLSRIELDPENPRKLAISLSDVRQGISPEDPALQTKQQELEKLKELAHTIRTSGIINPIVVYKRGESYRVVAGERRCLASILANKQEIEARVFNEKPKGFELKLVQWVENTAREDLSLGERLENVRDILKEYQKENGACELTASLLKTITGLSLSQASYYISVLKAPAEVTELIRQGELKNLDKAALISSVPQGELRHQLIEAYKAGASLKEMRSLIQRDKAATKAKRQADIVKHRGRATAKVNMGSTVSVKVIQALVEAIVSQKSYHKYREVFSNIKWQDMRQSSRAFRKLVEILEIETAV